MLHVEERGRLAVELPVVVGGVMTHGSPCRPTNLHCSWHQLF